MIDWSDYPNFSEDEFRCPCCGKAPMDPLFIERLQTMRSFLGFALIPTSGYRCEAYNASLGGSDRHPTGKAADLQMAPGRYEAAFLYAMKHFRGKGLNKSGPHWEWFIHVDDVRDGLWTY